MGKTYNKNTTLNNTWTENCTFYENLKIKSQNQI